MAASEFDCSLTERFAAGRDDFVSPALEDGQVLTSHRMVPHHRVHGGGHQDGLLEVPGPHHAGQEVVGEAIGQFGEAVGGQRRNQSEVSPVSELDMEDRISAASPGPPLVLVTKNILTRSSELAEFRQEVPAVLCHYQLHTAIVELGEICEDFWYFYRGHTARAADQNVHHL